MTPRRLKLATMSLLAAALIASSVSFSGSTPASPAAHAKHHGPVR
jgi:hypothetical protein